MFCVGQFCASITPFCGSVFGERQQVALYELIKNGLDAGSEEILIDIQVVMQPSVRRALLRKWSTNNSKSPQEFMIDVKQAIDITAPDEVVEDFLASISTKTRDEALNTLEAACAEFNYINVIDSGRGMDAELLDSCYLTVGTTNRLLQKQSTQSGERVPLGEKGIGRLAAMRLGHVIEVISSMAGQPNEFHLLMDWRPVYEDPNLNLDDEALEFTPEVHGKKSRKHGTSILIKDLQSDWDMNKLKELSTFDLGKLADPFASSTASQFLNFKFQGNDAHVVNVFEAARLKSADAICSITYRAGTVESEKIDETDEDEAEASLTVKTTYKRFNREEVSVLLGAHLAAAVSFEPKRRRAAQKLPGSDEVVAALKSLGNFEARFYWFNRGRLIKEDKTLWAEGLGDFVRSWSGGLLVYRDGYRVYPYGSPQDDWLDLDRRALASSAYKLNRAQIVGYLRITSKDNPKLVDQTNREGFRDAPEKEALRRLLRQAIIADCKSFLETVDKENKISDAETLQEIDARIGDASQSAADNLKRLKRRVPAEAETIQSVLQELGEVQDAWFRAKATLKAREEEVETYTHLAGVGLMVELLAHELARSTADALELLADKKTANDPKKLQALTAVLKTLNRRIRVIDALSIPGRQRKAVHHVPAIVAEMKEFYETKFKRHDVDFIISQSGNKPFNRKVEHGQIIQILDNLFNNSVFWLSRRLNRSEPAKINVTIDANAGTVSVVDNGPGISEDVGNRVFDAFYTSKGASGRGLGLFIATKLATENDIKLELLPAEDGIHHGFLLTF